MGVGVYLAKDKLRNEGKLGAVLGIPMVRPVMRSWLMIWDIGRKMLDQRCVCYHGGSDISYLKCSDITTAKPLVPHQQSRPYRTRAGPGKNGDPFLYEMWSWIGWNESEFGVAGRCDRNGSDNGDCFSFAFFFVIALIGRHFWTLLRLWSHPVAVMLTTKTTEPP